MRKTYKAFVEEKIREAETSEPIYTRKIAEDLADAYGLTAANARAATSCAVKRIMDSNSVPELRRWQNGIYYRAVGTPFGEKRISRSKLIADKYLLPDIGYETDDGMLHKVGLTTWMPNKRVIATNAAKRGFRKDEKLGVYIRPSKTTITKENKGYLQILDILDLMNHAPVDAYDPYGIVAECIQKLGLKYETLLGLADEYYDQNTMSNLAKTARV